MKKKFSLILLIIILSAFQGYSQAELKLYSGVFDRLGLSLEYMLSEKTAIEFGASYNTRKTTNFYIDADVDNRESNIYINGMLKHYTSNENPGKGFYYGLYLRYWQEYNAAIGIDAWTSAQINEMVQENAWVSDRTHKISAGGLLGYKILINNRFNISFTGGIGFSPRSLFWREIDNYNDPIVSSLIGRDDWVGYWNHLSLLGHVAFGYRFGSK